MHTEVCLQSRMIFISYVPLWQFGKNKTNHAFLLLQNNEWIEKDSHGNRNLIIYGQGSNTTTVYVVCTYLPVACVSVGKNYELLVWEMTPQSSV